MFATLIQILPLILIIAFGYGLKKAKFLTAGDGSSLLKLVFYAGSPALVFTSIMKANIDGSLIILCFLPVAVVAVTMLAVVILRRSLLKRLPVKTFGTLLSGAVIMNTFFLIPFVQQLYGAPGLAMVVVIDIVNALLIFSVIYAAVVKVGHDTPDYGFVAKKLLLAPPLWALTIAIIFKLGHIGVPAAVTTNLAMVAALVSPVVLIAMGLKFTPRISQPKLLAVPLALRFILGAAIGLVFVTLTGLHGLSAQIAVFASIAPIGFYSIVFSELEELDVRFAVSQVSAGLMIAIVTTPFLVYFLQFL